MHAHVGPKRGDLGRKPIADFGADARGIVEQRRLNRHVESPDLLVGKLIGASYRREFGVQQDLVAVGIADPAEDGRHRECPLERAVLCGQTFSEGRQVDLERLKAAAVVLLKELFVLHAQARSMLVSLNQLR